jgi:ribosomal protein S18 acetylase RimI-like enzyme
MEISRLTENNLVDLAELFKQFWNEASSLEKMRSTFKKVSRNPNYLFLVGKVDDAVVGSVTGIICQGLYGECRPFMVIEDVIVSKGFRRRGIGTRLMRELERIATESECSQIILVTESNRTDAVCFYHSLGYDVDKYTGLKKKL